MTREEIRSADEKTLQARWIELINDVRTYAPGKSEQNVEYLMIGLRLALIRDQKFDAIGYAEELGFRYGISICEVE